MIRASIVLSEAPHISRSGIFLINVEIKNLMVHFKTYLFCSYYSSIKNWVRETMAIGENGLLKNILFKIFENN